MTNLTRPHPSRLRRSTHSVPGGEGSSRIKPIRHRQAMPPFRLGKEGKGMVLVVLHRLVRTKASERLLMKNGAFPILEYFYWECKGKRQ
jgi:hypothetical protein